MRCPEVYLCESRNQYFYTINFSETKLRDVATLKLLETRDENYLQADVVFLETSAKVFFKETFAATWSEYVEGLDEVQKIFFCMKTATLSKSLEYFQVPIICPENIFVMGIDELRIGCRGLYQLVYPYVSEHATFIAQRKALIISTLFPEFTFYDIFEGNLLIRELPELAQQLYESTSNTEVTSVLKVYYEQIASSNMNSMNLFDIATAYGGYLLFVMFVIVMLIL